MRRPLRPGSFYHLTYRLPQGARQSGSMEQRTTSGAAASMAPPPLTVTAPMTPRRGCFSPPDPPALRPPVARVIASALPGPHPTPTTTVTR